jgi:hypothetical protein
MTNISILSFSRSFLP